MKATYTTLLLLALGLRLVFARVEESSQTDSGTQSKNVNNLVPKIEDAQVDFRNNKQSEISGLDERHIGGQEPQQDGYVSRELQRDPYKEREEPYRNPNANEKQEVPRDLYAGYNDRQERYGKPNTNGRQNPQSDPKQDPYSIYNESEEPQRDQYSGYNERKEPQRNRYAYGRQELPRDPFTELYERKEPQQNPNENRRQDLQRDPYANGRQELQSERKQDPYSVYNESEEPEPEYTGYNERKEPQRYANANRRKESQRDLYNERQEPQRNPSAGYNDRQETQRDPYGGYNEPKVIIHKIIDERNMNSKYDTKEQPQPELQRTSTILDKLKELVNCWEVNSINCGKQKITPKPQPTSTNWDRAFELLDRFGLASKNGDQQNPEETITTTTTTTTTEKPTTTTTTTEKPTTTETINAISIPQIIYRFPSISSPKLQFHFPTIANQELHYSFPPISQRSYHYYPAQPAYTKRTFYRVF